MKIADLLFGCWHRRRSFPITAKRGQRRGSEAALQTGTYTVCLDCGKEFAYDWQQMRTLDPGERQAAAGATRQAEAQ